MYLQTNRRLHEFPTANNFFLINSFRHVSLLNVHVYQFLAKRVSRSIKTVHTNLLAKICKLHKNCNLQLEFRKITPFGHALPPHGYLGRF